jgi:hypothetical protein
MTVTTGTRDTVVPPRPVQSAPAADSPAPFIRIDPVGDKNTGDLIIISGTTNLPSGTGIYLKERNESTGEMAMRANTYACPDPDGVNRWSLVLESTMWMRPGNYGFRVSTPGGDVTDSVQFDLTGRYSGPEEIRYYSSGSRTATISGTGAPFIHVDPIGDRHKGDIFRISGTTNLAEGTLLDCTIWPVFYEDRSKRPSQSAINGNPCNDPFAMNGRSAVVVKGTGDANRWSFPADMTNMKKTEMLVRVSTTDQLLTKREIFGNASFRLL